ncbi:MAG TPA: TraR/DksA C4-type zinc finger protein [Caldilineaceae bacterium]|nr:TraR/DksA C4-type zinc finger protein [Caldilineaceae bacterium]
MMNSEWIAQQKERLLQLRCNDQEVLQHLQADTKEGIEETEVKEAEELSAINTQHQIDMAESNLLQERLTAIDRALKAIEEGHYGTCDRCGKPINPDRLVANPLARYCLPCQEIVDAA